METNAVEYPLHSKETYKDVILNGDLAAKQQQQVRQVIRQHQTVLTDRPGRTDLVEVTLTVTDPTPVRQKLYLMPLSQQRAIKEEIDTLLAAGIISESTSPYSAGTVLLRKPNGELRLCIDFRLLNAVTHFQPEPLPDTTDLFAKLQAAKNFSRIDLSKWY
ncbi:hypothetical protein, partial [Acinetobacter baumannii]|uniref:hypothetical protein n=1 Tax=Acinetobacter baumannii TaxID=470 RepID=UPI003390EDC1